MQPNSTKLTQLNFIFKAISQRMQDRLDYIKFQPNTIIDLGSGANVDLVNLQHKYSQSTIYLLDNDINFLKRFAPPKKFLQKILNKNKQLICGDIQFLPFKNNSIDLIWANLTISYPSLNLSQVFKSIHHTLSAKGCILLSGLGVDSFKELKTIGLNILDFPDMHLIGDLLVQIGFDNPVLDRELLTIEYDSWQEIIHDLCTIKQTIPSQKITPIKKDFYHKLAQEFQQIKKNNKYPITLEVFFINAWQKNIPSAGFAEKVIKFFPPSGKK